jgi:hypothetical protein
MGRIPLFRRLCHEGSHCGSLHTFLGGSDVGNIVGLLALGGKFRRCNNFGSY